MVLGKLVFISLSVFVPVSLCVFFVVVVFLVSHFCTATLGSQFISVSSNVDFLVTQIKFVTKYIKSTIQFSSTQVS